MLLEIETARRLSQEVTAEGDGKIKRVSTSRMLPTEVNMVRVAREH